MPSNSIMGILEDAAGNLWISTQRGLCLAEEEPIYFQLLGDLPFQDAIYVEEGEFCLK
ncbi:MAG: hypothetical protein D6722_13730 [Bacteroidetes bacterium]|nr:MAG: hypothetical protein D6722_13730 [Bacteroidota bacterium]